MQEDFSGIKELYDVSLRLNNPVELNGRKYDINEAILTFKTVELSTIQEKKREVQARGGQGNRLQIYWQTDSEMEFSLINGVLSPTSWAMLSNSKISRPSLKSVIYNEELQAIEDGTYCYVMLKYWPNSVGGMIGAQPKIYTDPIPVGRREELMLKPLSPSKKKWIFCYDMETGKSIKDFSIYGNKVFFKEFYRKVMVDYTFDYEDNIRTLEVGNRLFKGFLRLDGKMSVKDEKSGEVSTAILEMPKIKLSSNLSMRLGKNYENSIVSDFYFTGYPDDSCKENNIVANITFLDKELTGDYI